MNWLALIKFMVYGGLAVGAMLVWWVFYTRMLTRGFSARDAVFGQNPKPAVALDLMGGVVAMGILIRSALVRPPLETFVQNMEAALVTLAITIVLLGVLRWVVNGVLWVWFRGKTDIHGDPVTVNNELFLHNNLAAGLFSATVYLVLAAGLIQEDMLNLAGYRQEGTFNILGVWALGAATIFFHSLLYLGFSREKSILYQGFHHNNPAAALSLMGLMSGMLLLNHMITRTFMPGQHMFNQPELWAYLGTAMVLVLVVKTLARVVFWFTLGLDVRKELVARQNAAWGLIDGGLILSLFIILVGLLA
ncbi:MAG: DUF350 domain-containing protein [Deltaproteobacteria bacterium]|nr:DUF350 domain-containing protein [Deltaproteobacteria bacterium]